MIRDHALIKLAAAEYVPILEKKNFKINKAKLFKLTCSEHLQWKSVSPRLLGSVDFEAYMLNVDFEA
jgi:hypothetical protein